MSYTKGPWIRLEHETQPCRIKAEHNGWDVADVFSTDHPTGAANARLIAAAPDLLEACKFFMASLESGLLVRDISKDGSSTWALSMMAFVRDLAKAQAAIYKADGETLHTAPLADVKPALDSVEQDYANTARIAKPCYRIPCHDPKCPTHAAGTANNA